MTWRLHLESEATKWHGTGWRMCADPQCQLEHVEYEPFKPIDRKKAATP